MAGPAEVGPAEVARGPIGVILAGGQSRRMGGGDKALLQIDGQSLLDHVAARLRPQVPAMVLNANGDAGRFDSAGLTVVPDGLGGHLGPLAGVLAGLDHAAGLGAEHIVTVAADTPFFPADLVARLTAAAAGTGAPIALAATRDGDRVVRHPTFGLWPVALRDDLRASLRDGLRKIVLWTDRHRAASVVFDSPGRDPFFNVNTPDDLRRARDLAGWVA